MNINIDIDDQLRQELKSFLTGFMTKACLTLSQDIAAMVEQRSDTIHEIDDDYVRSLLNLADDFDKIGDRSISSYSESFATEDILEFCKVRCEEFDDVTEELTQTLSTLIDLLNDRVFVTMRLASKYKAGCNAEAIRLSSEIKERATKYSMLLHGRLRTCYDKASE